MEINNNLYGSAGDAFLKGRSNDLGGYRQLRRPKQESIDKLARELKANLKVDPEGAYESSDLFGVEFDIANYFYKSPKSDWPVVATKHDLTIPEIGRPIGITLLANGDLVVGDRAKNCVFIYGKDGKRKKEVRPLTPFKRPSDMVTLPDGRFAVRDDKGLKMFTENGDYLNDLAPKGALGMCFGLAADCRGHLMTINTNRRGVPGCLTGKGETDILIISCETGIIENQIQLVNVIEDQRKSACRFLHCDGKKLYIVDLGLNRVYVMDLATTQVRCFGGTGTNPGHFKDAAGVAADTEGNILVADACNNRVQIFNKFRKFVGFVEIPDKVKLNRPSGILLDPENQALYILNLWSNSLSKFSFVK